MLINVLTNDTKTLFYSTMKTRQVLIGFIVEFFIVRNNASR